MKKLESIQATAKELYQSIPNEFTHQNILCQQIIEGLQDHIDAEEPPNWMYLVDDLVRYVGVAIMVAAYIFRSMHTTQKQTISDSVKAAIQAQAQIMQYLHGAKGELNVKYSGFRAIIPVSKQKTPIDNKKTIKY